MFDHLSADGYFATEDGKLDWVVPDEELTQSNLHMAEADTILFGRRTYEMFESFWPKAIKDHRGAEDPHARPPFRVNQRSESGSTTRRKSSSRERARTSPGRAPA